MLENAFQLLAGSLFLMLRIVPAGSYPRPLSREEEQDCLERAAAGDLEARNRLVEHNMRLVAHIVKKYYSQSGEVDDLLSIGTIGLIKGINSYRAEKGVRLATYASRCIENEILMHFRAQRRTAGDVSLSEALDSEDEDGSLSFLDVVAQEDDLAERLLTGPEGLFAEGMSIRLIGVGVSRIAEKQVRRLHQMDIFEWVSSNQEEEETAKRAGEALSRKAEAEKRRSEKQAKLDSMMEKINRRYGDGTLEKGCILKDEE